MRPWVLLRHFELPFEEIRVSLFVEGFERELARYSPTLRVPVLIDGDTTVWDSLAIMEYVSEKFLAGRGLPGDMQQRAQCRSYCSDGLCRYSLAIADELQGQSKAGVYS